jgi:hypothetical protein
MSRYSVIGPQKYVCFLMEGFRRKFGFLVSQYPFFVTSSRGLGRRHSFCEPLNFDPFFATLAPDFVDQAQSISVFVHRPIHTAKLHCATDACIRYYCTARVGCCLAGRVRCCRAARVGCCRAGPTQTPSQSCPASYTHFTCSDTLAAVAHLICKTWRLESYT